MSSMATLLPEDFLFPDIMVDSLVWLFIHSTKKICEKAITGFKVCDKACSNVNPEDKCLVNSSLPDSGVYGPDFHLKLGDENSFENWRLAAGGSKNAGNGVGPRCLYFRGVFCRMKPEMHRTPSFSGYIMERET